MNVYIANFGEENYEWPICVEKSTVATMNDIDAQQLWEQGKRDEYIASRLKGKTAAGLTPTKQVASRWFNLMTIISQTNGDIWIHRDGEKLYWTISKIDPPFFDRKVEPVGRKRDVVVCHKPCDAWTYRTRNGNQLLWRSLHPKARDFLSTEATLQKLGDDNAQYAISLINGDALDSWHNREIWQTKNTRAAKEYSPVTSASNIRKTAFRLARTALITTNQSNGQATSTISKNKDFCFPTELQLEDYIVALIGLQDGLCALTDLPFEMDELDGDKELFCSLDRIDSDGHYEKGNLQIVCRFANRWKSDSDNEEFRRLLQYVRTSNTV